MASLHAVLRKKTNILDLPEEMLRRIILLLTARERLPLGDSCQRFKSLVFETREVLEYLDFSKKGYLTTIKDIHQYFDDKNACEHILRVNARYVECLKPGYLVINSIGKATNLVEVNIRGTRFKDIRQMGSFLEPLLHLVKLSIDWPETVEDDIGLYRQILQRPFRKLRYLSVDLTNSALAVFPNALLLCQQLEKLVIDTVTYVHGVDRNFSNSEFKKLTSLKIVQYLGGEATEIKKELANVLPDPERWTDGKMDGRTERSQIFLNSAPWQRFNLGWVGWVVDPERLLKAVMNITHEDVPEKFCCLSPTELSRTHLLKVEHAKMLLKDPRSQIPYLYLNHKVERGCDTHLLASAFPNLSELVLSAVTGNSETPPKDSNYRRRLRRRCSPVPEEQDESLNVDSSFKMLVENTPHLRHFTLNPNAYRSEDCDLDALNAISAWKSLESLYIYGIPIGDGQFLIEIGKQCKNLQKLCLSHLPLWGRSHYEDALFEMLKHCEKLRKFTISQSEIDQVEMFKLLAQNVDLERVIAHNEDGENSISDWIQSLENLIRKTKLTTVICTLSVKSEDEYQEVKSAVERWKGEFRHREFQIQVNCLIPDGTRRGTRSKYIAGKVYSDTRELELFCSR